MNKYKYLHGLVIVLLITLVGSTAMGINDKAPPTEVRDIHSEKIDYLGNRHNKIGNSVRNILAVLTDHVLSIIPEHSTVINVGRSPLLINHIMRAAAYFDYRQTRTLTINHLHFSGTPNREAEERNLLTDEREAYYFNNHLNGLTLRGDEKQLYIVDVIATGDSMISFLKLFQKYWEKHFSQPLPEIIVININNSAVNPYQDCTIGNTVNPVSKAVCYHYEMNEFNFKITMFFLKPEELDNYSISFAESPLSGKTLAYADNYLGIKRPRKHSTKDVDFCGFSEETIEVFSEIYEEHFVAQNRGHEMNQNEKSALKRGDNPLSLNNLIDLFAEDELQQAGGVYYPCKFWNINGEEKFQKKVNDAGLVQMREAIEIARDMAFSQRIKAYNQFNFEPIRKIAREHQVVFEQLFKTVEKKKHCIRDFEVPHYEFENLAGKKRGYHESSSLNL